MLQFSGQQQVGGTALQSIAQALQSHSQSCFLLTGTPMLSREVAVQIPCGAPCYQQLLKAALLSKAAYSTCFFHQGAAQGELPSEMRHSRLSIFPRQHPTSYEQSAVTGTHSMPLTPACWRHFAPGTDGSDSHYCLFGSCFWSHWKRITKPKRP